MLLDDQIKRKKLQHVRARACVLPYDTLSDPVRQQEVNQEVLPRFICDKPVAHL